ncbi:hypothetical protein DFQ27_005829 [Actinomortierella ambigua]|uniref:F-box domain-containing protein n=1 Tax=Actinomortierella ambigua TaxID=1343610 RepID=A0A9P6UB44_9FUNG|nr:hypothetical protein DFQ27_005829 [Actinomortierella ambigua]
MSKTLPFDCLLLVLDAVEDLTTLNALLRVSHALFRAAACKLYRDPFDSLSRTSDRKRSFHAFERLVLSLSPAGDERTERYRDMLSVQKLATHDNRHSQSSRTAQPKPTTDYLGLIRQFHWGPNPQKFSKYLGTYRTMTIFASDFGMNARLTTAGMQHLLTWAACGHQPERIESLYIYTGETTQYLATMDKWTSLRSIVLDPTTYASHGSEGRTYSNLAQGMQLLNNLAIYRGPKSLLSLTFLQSDTSSPPSTMSKTLMQDMLRHLAPLRQPKAIGPHNWDRFSAWAGEVDFSHLESLDLPASTSWDAMARWWPDLSLQKILQQCCQLSRLETSVGDALIFRWAVAAKTGGKLRGIGGGNSLLMDGNSSDGLDFEDKDDDSDSEDDEGSSPCPLKTVQLNMTCRVWDRPVTDLFRAFGETLEHVEIRGDTRSPSLTLRIGPSHSPRLRHLSIKSPRRLWLGPQTLSFSPRLESITLHDALQTLVDKPVDRWKVCRWPCLSHLSLVGSPAVQFHPATLHECQKLQTLTVQSCRPMETRVESHIYANREQEHQARSLWTWDWYLPNLTELSLVGEYAMWFEMKLLAYCPQLETLRLRMTWSKRVDLVLPKEWCDTTFPSSWPLSPPQSGEDRSPSHGAFDAIADMGNCGDSGGDRSVGRHVAQALKKISLVGRWDFSDDTLEVLLLNVLPNLEHLTLMKCTGFTTSCLM